MMWWGHPGKGGPRHRRPWTGKETAQGRCDDKPTVHLRIGKARPNALQRCSGCHNDFYNGNNPMGVTECWGVKTAKLVTRYRIGTWTQPDQPFAFTKVRSAR